MDPINILVGINLFVTLIANLSGAKSGLKKSVVKAVERPKTYLQKVPMNISALVLVTQILAVFQLGTLSYQEWIELNDLRIAGLLIFVVFSWIQIWSFRTLGSSYSQEIAILKNHELISSGPYKFVRHPQYLSQLLSDLGAGLALMAYVTVPLVLLLEIPLFILRARYEEKLLRNHFDDEFIEYKKKSGFMVPFVG